MTSYIIQRYNQEVIMANVIEEQLKNCNKCKKTTKHHRSNSKSSGFMLLVHLVLTVSTVGIWLISVII